MILMSLNSKQEEQMLRLLTFECKIEKKKIVLVISILNRQQSHKEY